MKKSGEKAKRGKGEKEKPRNIITAQTVRAALTKLGGAGSAAVAEHFQVKSYGEREKIQKVLGEMLHNGQVKSVREQGVATYHLCAQPVGPGAVQAKLWEFACLRFAAGKPFTCSEAARMAECGLDYAKRYYRWLWGAGYLGIVSRGRAGVLFYQVVGGKEHEAAPAWNRRAETRKSRGQGSGIRGQCGSCAFWDNGIPSNLSAYCLSTVSPKGDHRVQIEESCEHWTDRAAYAAEAEAQARRNEEAGETPALRPIPHARLDAALEDFGRALVEVAGSIERAWEIIREMKGELLAMEAHGHDEPGEPTEGHH